MGWLQLDVNLRHCIRTTCLGMGTAHVRWVAEAKIFFQIFFEKNMVTQFSLAESSFDTGLDRFLDLVRFSRFRYYFVEKSLEDFLLLFLKCRSRPFLTDMEPFLFANSQQWRTFGRSLPAKPISKAILIVSKAFFIQIRWNCRYYWETGGSESRNEIAFTLFVIDAYFILTHVPSADIEGFL